MSKTLIILLIAGAVILMAGGVAWAKSRGYCGGPERIVERVAEELALQPEQKDRLERLGRSIVDIREQWRGRREETKQQVLDLLSTPSFDRDRAAELVEQRQQVWHERGDMLLAQFADFSDSLDDAQREKLRTLIEERMGRRWHGPAWSH
jgi:Spy/CpxP family protein refolding chaperone